MDDRLEELARRLQACRRKGNKLTLECLLESARILAEAEAAAKRGFGSWLREKAHMDATTARHHLRVAEFVQGNRVLTPEIAKLSIAKIYALTTLDFAIAQRYITGQIKFSKPLDRLSDVQFRREFRERFPRETKRRTRAHVFQELYSALVRLEKSYHRARPHAAKLTPLQRRRLTHKLEAVMQAASSWKDVA